MRGPNFRRTKPETTILYWLASRNVDYLQITNTLKAATGANMSHILYVDGGRFSRMPYQIPYALVLFFIIYKMKYYLEQ